MQFPDSITFRLASPVGMIRGRVANVIKRFSSDRDHMRLAKFERVSGLDAEGKLLRRPAENSPPNLTPLWTNGNLCADGSHSGTIGISKRDVYVTVCFHFCVND